MLVDPDPIETREWIEALDSVLEFEGAERAHFLLGELIGEGRRRGAPVPYSPNTPYLNTIPPEREDRHPGDRATRCLFGDGGAVSVIAESQSGHRIREIRCGTAGRHYDKFLIPAGGMRIQRSPETARETVDQSGNIRTAEHIKMDGLGVLSFFNATVPCAVKETLAQNNLSVEDIDLFVFHQASQVALDSLCTALQISPKKMVYDLADTGNLVSASIPVALSRALESGKAKIGQLVLLCGFGVGLSWGTALLDL